MTNNAFWLAAGAFMTSPGLGGAGALAAAAVAWRKLHSDEVEANERRAGEAQAAREADERERWWLAMRWLWDARADLTEEEVVDFLTPMTPLAKTGAQHAFLRAMRTALIPDPIANEGEQR